MNNKKNPFSVSGQITSPEISFSEYLQNASYSIATEESTQILTSFRPSEGINLKSVIFYLAIRKAYKNSGLRYSKFAFYLIRSLYKESITRPNRPSSRYSKISKEKKQVLNGIQKFIQIQSEERIKTRFFKFCKDFPRVRLARIKRIETVTKVFVIFYKSVKKEMKNCLLKLRGPTKASKFFQKMQSFLFKTVFLPRKIQQKVVRVYTFLQKPKYNLPFIKFAQKSVKQKPFASLSKKLPSTSPTPSKSRKIEISKKHQRGIIRLCVLNRNYLVLKKKAFYRIQELLTIQKPLKTAKKPSKIQQRGIIQLFALNRNYLVLKKQAFYRLKKTVKWYKTLETKNKAQAFKERIESLLRNSFVQIALRIFSSRRDYEYFQFLTQVLTFVKHRCENSLATHAFDTIYNFQQKPQIDPGKIKYIYNFLRIINTKVFNKRFLGFILIKGFAKIRKTNRKFNRNSVFHFFDMVKKYKTVLKSFGLAKLKTFTNREKFLDNCFDFLGLLRKIYNRTRFYRYLETFDTIKQYSVTRRRQLLSACTRILTLFKKRYTTSTTVAFLKWENELYHSRKSFSHSFLYDNTLSLHFNSYSTHNSTPKLLPPPKNIHDYIDDILEITDSSIPTEYFYHY